MTDWGGLQRTACGSLLPCARRCLPQSCPLLWSAPPASAPPHAAHRSSPAGQCRAGRCALRLCSITAPARRRDSVQALRGGVRLMRLRVPGSAASVEFSECWGTGCWPAGCSPAGLPAACAAAPLSACGARPWQRRPDALAQALPPEPAAERVQGVSKQLWMLHVRREKHANVPLRG
jgi:hypothetical protein